MAGETHTDTRYQRINVEAAATQIAGPVNRNRVFHIDVDAQAPPVFVGENEQLTPLTGRLINPISGMHYNLGPQKSLYAVTVGPGDVVAHVTNEDSIDAGLYTDDGSGVKTAHSRGGDAPKDPVPTPRPGTDRAARQ
jgi:hypothetical protein